jgi:NCAIR mutase (PurE)-related protein
VDRDRLRDLLAQLAQGEVSVDHTLRELEGLPFQSLGFATVDSHRHLRQGFPEVIFGQGKTPDHVAQIFATLAGHGSNVLCTRADAAHAAAVKTLVPAAVHDPLSRTVALEQRPFVDQGRGAVAVVSAGTSDLPVAREAAVTAQLMGNRVEEIYDVGVAGLHRLLAHRERLRDAAVVVVVAGMEGALPSVVGGLIPRPIIAVPTSVGYGASFHGLAALLGMLNSCAAGVTVVNIDNGFGAGYAAALINRKTPAGAG